jgi:quinoprotein dehydrogenase-associated probable ABC transporter substrate-binding protein
MGTLSMSRAVRSLLIATLVAFGASEAWPQGAGLGAAGELVDRDALRVCADPSNMPFSDQNGQGFENKLAELVAEKTGRKSVAYTWYPMVVGFVRRTIRENRCDIIMGYAQGDPLVQNTNAYYRSAYVLVYKKGRGLDGIETLTDPRLAGKRVGVVQNTPPSTHLVKAGLMKTAKIYPLMIDTRVTPSVAESMLKDMDAGAIDAGVLWGPMAGYYVKKAGDDFVMVPLVHEQTSPRLAYRITMGVRPSDQDWKRELNRLIRENQKEINNLLIGYGVPLLDEQDHPITQ